MNKLATLFAFLMIFQVAFSASCYDGWKEEDGFCVSPRATSYGRGTGYPWKLTDGTTTLKKARKRCEKDHPEGCEQYIAIIYPKCIDGYNPSGCCTCIAVCPKIEQTYFSSLLDPLYCKM